MSRCIFITATDTGAGKTWVTAAAIRQLLADGVSALALKPVVCGLDEAGGNEDVQALLDAQRISNPDDISFYRFALPAAPSQAAADEGVEIDPDALLQWCAERRQDAEVCLIEGVGGLMVPLTGRWLVRDWIATMGDCELWLVVGCRLGAINHTLLTLEALKAMGRQPVRLILNAATRADERWLLPTRQAVAPFVPAGCAVELLGYGAEPG
ncbi:dethiobiotin synthase [Mariprofundus erugo]|uniref:ATP-dependent dethiobiotin synthetase BioD n=1 Tax=Mariprofundus erugo TaxID=2528639 RepID=A0A5R9GQJ7_9PROT|nr:dethiobiotin synthase [Mariprofundus erugo]TLS68551.1 dethiobiotin synthase [Mariprofundus erugo]